MLVGVIFFLVFKYSFNVYNSILVNSCLLKNYRMLMIFYIGNKYDESRRDVRVKSLKSNSPSRSLVTHSKMEVIRDWIRVD